MTKELQMALRAETKLLNEIIDFSSYNTNIPGYIVICCRKEYPEVLKQFGYSELTEEEKEICVRNLEYHKKYFYKIPEEKLLKRHSNKK